MKGNFQKGSIANCSYLCRIPGPRHHLSRKTPHTRRRNIRKLVKQLMSFMRSRDKLVGFKSIHGIVGYSFGSGIKIKHTALYSHLELNKIRRMRKKYSNMSSLLILVVYPNGNTSYEIIGQEVEQVAINGFDSELISFFKDQGVNSEILRDVKSLHLVAAYSDKKDNIKLAYSQLTSISDIEKIKLKHPNSAFRLILTYPNGATRAENIALDNCYFLNAADF